MKALALISMLTVLSAVPAVQASDTDTVSIAAPRLRIELPGTIYRMQPGEFRDFVQSYSLSDGKALSLFIRGKTMYAKVQDQPAHQIVAATPNTFVALDQKLKMTIELLDNGDVRGELLMAVPTESVANHGEAGEKLLAVSFR